MDHDPITILLTCLSYTSKAMIEESLTGITSEEWQAVIVLARHQTLRHSSITP